jgi:uncharacterized membrane protein HdeD (DUF308 family)
MNELLAHSWWVLALRGVIALVFGVAALSLPGLTLLWLVALFAVYAAFGGAVSLIGAVKSRKSDKGWWLMLLFGVISIGAGVLAVVYPGLTALVLVLLMGANALITGILDIAIAMRLRKFIHGEWVLIIAGLVSIVFGVFVLAFPSAGALALVWLIGFYAIFSGFLLVAFAFRVRSLANKGTDARHFRSATHTF